MLHLKVVWSKRHLITFGRTMVLLVLRLFLSGKSCPCKRIKTNLVTIAGMSYVADCEFKLKRAVSMRPVCAAVELTDDWKSYTGGILDGPNSPTRKLSHAVTIVAYGTCRRGKKYWIIEDSGGNGRGYGGYIYVACDLYPEGGTLGLARYCYFPTKKLHLQVPLIWEQTIRSESDTRVKEKEWRSIYNFYSR